MKTWTVTAKRWAGGWELHIDGLGVTQSRTLATAERIVRDYIETLTDESADGDSVVIQPEIAHGLVARVVQAREHTRDAERAQREAAQEVRDVVHDLRAEGLSVADTAALLGVSRGRVSQLVG